MPTPIESQRPGSEARRPRTMPAANGYAGEVPAYSLVRSTAVSGDVHTINRPNADSMTYVMATGPAAIGSGKNGNCSADWPLPVKYAGAAPSIGDERGTATDSFELTASKTGFNVVAVDSGNSLAWVVPAGGGGGGSGGTVSVTTSYLEDDVALGEGPTTILTMVNAGYKMVSAQAYLAGGTGPAILYLYADAACIATSGAPSGGFCWISPVEVSGSPTNLYLKGQFPGGYDGTAYAGDDNQTYMTVLYQSA